MTGERSLLRVSDNVTAQLAGCGEGLWAMWTLVRFLASVNVGVRLE